MKSMKKLLLPVVTGLLALALVIPAAAQDATATPDASGSTGSTTMGTGTLNCDSSTILLAGLAQRYFGYAPTDVTLGNYVYGQYGPLFDMSTMMASNGTDMTGEATADASGSMTGSATLVPSTTFLSPAVITGEDPACTQLRTSLETFFSTQMQMGTGAWDSRFGGMNGTGAAG